MTSSSVSCRLTVSIFSTITSSRAWRNGRFVHRHLVFCLATLVVLGTNGWDEIQEEGKDEERVYKRDNPLQNGCCVPPFACVFNAESYEMLAVLLKQMHSQHTNCQTNFNDNEGQFDPERDSQYPMLAIMDSETLIFPATADCSEYVSCNEED